MQKSGLSAGIQTGERGEGEKEGGAFGAAGVGVGCGEGEAARGAAAVPPAVKVLVSILLE